MNRAVLSDDDLVSFIESLPSEEELRAELGDALPEARGTSRREAARQGRE